MQETNNERLRQDSVNKCAGGTVVKFAPHICVVPCSPVSAADEDEEAEDDDKTREAPDAISVNLTHATAALINSPRGSGAQYSPFMYLEADTFGGDTTRRAAQNNSPLLMQFPPNQQHQPPELLDPSLLPGVENRQLNVLTQLMAEKHNRTNASTSDDAGEEDDDEWIPSKVTFSEDIIVFEYEKAVYESDRSPSDGFSAQPSSSPTVMDYQNYDEEDENAVHAPADIAFIPLIPNRRLVTGGNTITELRRYLASRGNTAREEESHRLLLKQSADDLMVANAGECTRRNGMLLGAPSLPLLKPGHYSPFSAGEVGDTTGRVAGFHSCMSSVDVCTPHFSDALDGSELILSPASTKRNSSTNEVASFAPAVTV